MADPINALAAAAANYVGMAVFQIASSFGLSIGTAATIANVAALATQALVTVGSYAGLAMLTAPEIPKPGAGKFPFNQTMPPRQRVVNRARMSGPRMLYEARKNLYQVMAVAQGPMLRWDGYWLHSDPVTIDGSSKVVPPGPTPAKYRGNGLWIYNRLGADPETSFSSLGPWGGETLADLGADVWTSAHRGDGVASLLLVASPVEQADYRKVYPFGHPQLSALPVGAVYDWREDSSRGGSGSQRLDDQSTWAESWNPVLWLAQIESGPADRSDFVARWERKIAPLLAAWTAAADHCEEQVDLAAGGTVDRYRVAGWYMDPNHKADVRMRILACCDGFLSQAGNGALHIQVGVWRAPTRTIPHGHVKALRWKRGKRSEDALNDLAISYLDPDQNWTVVPGEPWRDEDDISLRGLKSARFDADWVPGHSQARRLAKISQQRTMADGEGVVRTTLMGLNILFGAPTDEEDGVANRRWINLERERADGTIETVAVELKGSPRIDLKTLSIEFDVCRAVPTAYDWDETTEEGTPPDSDIETVDPGIAPADYRGDLVTVTGFDFAYLGSA
jgi:hypothetical protein